MGHNETISRRKGLSSAKAKGGPSCAHALAAAALSLACCMLAPCLGDDATAYADGANDTVIYVQANEEQISWTVPVAVHFKVNADGTFQTPTNGKFTNTSVYPIYVYTVQATPASGVTLAPYSSVGTAQDTVGIRVTPEDGSAIELASHTSAAAPATPSEWNIAKGGELSISFAGKIGSYGSIKPNTDTKVVSVTWVAATGTAS